MFDQISVAFFDDNEKANAFRFKNGGWLYEFNIGTYWFCNSFRPKTILTHPLIKGVVGKLK